MKKSLIILLLLILALVKYSAAQNAPTPTGNITSVSDIHFNPFYDPLLLSQLIQSDYKSWATIFASSKITQPNGYNNDSNYPLFISALAAMKKQNPTPGFMIISGDFLCHSFQSIYGQTPGNVPDSLQSFISKTINFMAMTFDQYFPKTIILPVLGNNDSFCGDYALAPTDGFLTVFAKAWVPLQRNHNKTTDEAFVRSFSKGGYYTFKLRDSSGGTVVLLNTIFFSVNYTNCGTATNDPATIELAWLKQELIQSGKANARLWLVDHIPPGINVNPTLSGTKACLQNTVLMWKEDYNQQFLDLLTKYAHQIRANFSGHTHMDDFRVLYKDATPISFVHITPAVSPLFDNNPGFECITYNKQTLGLINSKTYYMPINKSTTSWTLEYDFQKAYGVTAINATSLNQVRKKIFADTVYRNRYSMYYNVSNPTTTDRITESNWKGYWCGTGNLTIASFNQCYCQPIPQQK